MAKIVTNELAPKDVKHFSLANANIEVPCETDDPVVLANASAHPWLTVEREPVPEVEGQFVDRQIKPEDDPMSYLNDDSNNPDAVRAHFEDQQSEDATPLAVEAGKDQNKPEVEGGVAVTLAADDTDSTDSAPKRRSSKKED